MSLVQALFYANVGAVVISILLAVVAYRVFGLNGKVHDCSLSFATLFSLLTMLFSGAVFIYFGLAQHSGEPIARHTFFLVAAMIVVSMFAFVTTYTVFEAQIHEERMQKAEESSHLRYE